LLFFQRTFITEGMRLLLDSVVKRLSGKGGDPVIQLQTAFGGGKTHTMLAVYHLAKGEVAGQRLPGVRPSLTRRRHGIAARAQLRCWTASSRRPTSP
jgi:predicted AAA+ superfamily ATPase